MAPCPPARGAAVPLAVLACVALAAPARADAEHLEAGPEDGHIVVNVYRAGLLSSLAHDHHFVVARWAATVDVPDGDPARGTLNLVLDAASLHDTQGRLSEAERRRVDARAAGPDGLDAAHSPRVVFRSERIELSAPATPDEEGRGTIHGVLTVRGRSVPLEVAFEAEGAGSAWRVRGKARVKQTALGIVPFRGFAGTIKVEDEVEVDFAFSLAPR